MMHGIDSLGRPLATLLIALATGYAIGCHHAYGRGWRHGQQAIAWRFHHLARTDPATRDAMTALGLALADAEREARRDVDAVA